MVTYDFFVDCSRDGQDDQAACQSTQECTARYHRLVAERNKRDADQLRAKWSRQHAVHSLAEPSFSFWSSIAAPQIDLSLLAPCSFFLQFTFTLSKSYLSRDDEQFYIIDNPIVRDKVFRLPMVRPTAWKGNLYSALWHAEHDKSRSDQLQRLFGDASTESSGRAGRLYFYPTFFTQTGLEIVNPHDRRRRVGKNPILIECVPAGAKGTFSLLYLPFDLVTAPDEARRQAAADLALVAEGIRDMMLTYGFSAKRSSGYGLAHDEIVEGEVRTQAGKQPLTRLSQLAQEVKGVAF